MSGRVLLITLTGEMDPRLAAEFDDVELDVGRGITSVVVYGADASALSGMLDRIDALGLELLGVEWLDEGTGV